MNLKETMDSNKEAREFKPMIDNVIEQRHLHALDYIALSLGKIEQHLSHIAASSGRTNANLGGTNQLLSAIAGYLQKLR